MAFVALTVLAAVWLTASACERTNDEDTVNDDERASLTLDDVYARLKAAVTQEGQVLHSARRWQGQGAPPGEEQGDKSGRIDEVWLDASRGALHERGGEPQYDNIVLGSVRYGVSTPGERRMPAGGCHGRYEQALAALLACEGFLEDEATQVDTDAQYEGETAVDIVTSGRSVGDWIFDVTQHVYLDAETFLPLATVREHVARGDSEPFTLRLVVTFEHEFVGADTLPADFFDPASVGYVEVDPAAGLNQDVGISVYWLGREFSAEGGRPGLKLQTSNVVPADPGRGPGERASLIYDDARQFGQPLVDLSEWRPEEWDAFVRDVLDPTPREVRAIPAEGFWWDWPCTERAEASLPDGRALIFWRVYPPELSTEPLTPGPCLPGEPDQFRAHVYLNGTLIIVETWLREGNPYGSVEAMREIVRGLVPYAPPSGP